MYPIMGACAFVLFFLNDLNDWKWSCSFLKVCFPAGLVMLFLATAAEAFSGPAFTGGAVRALLLALAAGFAALLVYTLFFALPVKDAYQSQGEVRTVCTAGVYALCRHPGVLWFAGLYLCLWAATGLSALSAVLYCGLNVALVWFEDRYVFPARLAGYDEYRRTTPFLIPNGASIGRCCAKR